MALTPGTRLGAYDILTLIGSGGMGEVYRARDTRLDRIVAIKVLSAHLADKPELRERFEREARTIASLNHPHISVLYDIGHQDGIDFLVMEHLEGETLAARLTKGPLPVEQVLHHAIDIADALDKAHRKGVTHRDLKPGNIMLTKSGAKLLDFGLAKLAAPVVPLSEFPTVQDPITAEGTILGTLQYMSPEQVEGKEADARTDIFAFGAVVYEMATGKRAFEGKSAASVMAAILEREPPAMSTLQPLTPPMLDRVVKNCLAKDPENRWQSARDLMRDLQWISESGREAEPHAAAAVRRKSNPGAWSVAVVSLLVAVLALGAAAYIYRMPRAAPTMVQFAFTIREGERFGDGAGLALSPGSSRLVFQAFDERGVSRLYVRAMDSLDSRPLAGTEGGQQPFFSPDGQWVGFFADRKLKKIVVAGGEPVELSDAPNPRGGSWGTDGTVVFTPKLPSGLWRVSANGGTPMPVTTLDPKNALDRHQWPDFLPGGNAVLFSKSTTGNWDDAEIVVQSLDTRERRVLVRGGRYARYMPPGYIVYARSDNLLAIPFDVSRLEVTGEAVPIVGDVRQSLVTGGTQFSLSSGGALAYVPGGLAQDRRTLVWVDRKGVPRPVGTHPAGRYFDVSLSPDGDRLVVGSGVFESDAWAYDLARGVLSRLTSDRGNVSPIWTPDGKRVIYWKRAPTVGLFWRAADGSGNEESLYKHDRLSTTATALGSWSRDGRVLVFTLGDPATGADLWTVSLDGDRKPTPLIQTQFAESQPDLSPDGRWLAYTSNLSGRNEVYVQPFPDLAGKWQISADGGDEPRWAANGRELFYRSGDRMMAVDVRPQPIFQPEPARTLFEGSYAQSYDVAPDGQHFVMIKQDEPATSLTEARVVLGWVEELKRRVPTK